MNVPARGDIVRLHGPALAALRAGGWRYPHPVGRVVGLDPCQVPGGLAVDVQFVAYGLAVVLRDDIELVERPIAVEAQTVALIDAEYPVGAA